MASPLPLRVVGYGGDAVPRGSLLWQGVPAGGPRKEHDELTRGAEGNALRLVPLVVALGIALKRWRFIVFVLICGRTMGGRGVSIPVTPKCRCPACAREIGT